MSRSLRAWCRWTVLGETAGFAGAALVGVTATVTDQPAAAVYLLTVLAGAGEGVLLGWGQSVGFRATTVRVPAGPWIAATGAAAATAWAVAMVATLLPDAAWDSAWIWPGAVAVGAVVLVSIPLAQTWVLAGVAARAWRWFPTSIGAWALGLLWTAAPSPFIDEQTPVLAIWGCYLVAGLLMATTVAVVTGVLAVRLEPREPSLRRDRTRRAAAV